MLVFLISKKNIIATPSVSSDWSRNPENSMCGLYNIATVIGGQCAHPRPHLWNLSLLNPTRTQISRSCVSYGSNVPNKHIVPPTSVGRTMLCGAAKFSKRGPTRSSAARRGAAFGGAVWRTSTGINLIIAPLFLSPSEVGVMAWTQSASPDKMRGTRSLTNRDQPLSYQPPKWGARTL